ncbi:hypothetical protein [Ectobacillus panaciterrae]|uniref:hypothetical protein n=1 Tax=Ectobacillus panaciterrae TaxID=363872 RepID=UPI00041BCA34|nr:hypothetical protein [Ectobacillus panaciterrae]
MKRTIGEVVTKIKEKESNYGKLVSLHSVVLNEYTHYKVIVTAYYTKTLQETYTENIAVEKVYSLSFAKQTAKEVADVLKQEFPAVDVAVRVDKVGE